ncbi:MAG: nucleotidyltransferase family protein [Betaproteobacteria bacterium]|nr:nucleotidyltransferase family protein [Betaproteobacteria bacterium]
MKKQDALDFLESHKQFIIERFGVKHLALFGSIVRDEAREDSDLDVLVEFEGGENYRNYFDLLFYLEDHLHCEIDLVSRDAVRPQLKPYVEKEALYVA